MLCFWGPTWETTGLGKQGIKPMGTLEWDCFSKVQKGLWLLKTPIIRNHYLPPRWAILHLTGEFNVLRQKIYNDTAQENQWWGGPNHTEPQPHPLANFSNLHRTRNNLTANIDWQVPMGQYWICGKQAYTVLPNSWFESCTLGSIRSSFFLLPLRQGENLGASIYKNKIKRTITGCLTNWQLKRKQMASWAKYPVLWSCHLGRRLVLGLSHPYICSTASSGYRLLLKL
jgi:hypothetical protein